jgi:vacuolar protein sorting-associated protein 13A/C
MLEGLIADVLNKVLGEFIEDITADQLNVSVFGGEVKLENVAIKSSLFDSMPVPFSLAFGKIGLIKLDIPISSILSKPLIIQISDVLVVMKPKPMDSWNEDVEIKAFKSANLSKIQSYEIIQRQAETIKNKDPGKAEKMIQQILSNIKIDIKNIFIKLEDDITSNSRGSFSLGMSMDRLLIGNCNENWEIQEFSDKKEDIIRKLAQLKNFSITMDWFDKGKQNDFLNCEDLYRNDSENTKFRAIIEQNIEPDRDTHKYLLDQF